MNKLKPELIKLTPEERLYGLEKPIVGLTGGIATGKSTVTKLLQERGIQIIDADRLVKDIYAGPEAREFIQKNYPDAWKEGAIIFPKLREMVFSDPSIKKAVEEFIYARLPTAFKKACEKIRAQDFYVYDVPLLFERGLDKKIDVKAVVYAPENLQLQRLLLRDGSSEKIARKILESQMSIESKKNRADFTISNTAGLENLVIETERFLAKILQ